MGKKPLYTKIFDSLKESINNKQYAADQQLPTEQELMKQFGVSRITVKRAMDELEAAGYIYRRQGSGSFVAQESEKEKGSVRNDDPFSDTIGFILPSFASSGLSEYIQGASDEAERRGYRLSIHTTQESTVKEREFLHALPKGGIRGIIFYPTNVRSNMDVIYAMHMNQYPIVTIDKHCEGLPVSSVVAHNYAGGRMAADHLIKLGHSRIAFVSSVGLDAAPSVKNRYFGYCQALVENGIPNDPELVILDFLEAWNTQGGEHFYASLLNRLLSRGVTAIQAENDIVAVNVMKAAIGLGVSVPEQLSVVGFDNSDIAPSFAIPLSTVEQPFYAIGRKAAELIANGLESRATEEGCVLPVSWIERKSSAPVSDKIYQPFTTIV